MKLTENLKAVLLLMAAFAAVSPVMQAKDRISRNLRPYDEGPLRWEEFRLKITHADSTSATILNVWRPETSKEKFGNMVVRRMVMRNYFDKDGSWVSPESRSVSPERTSAFSAHSRFNIITLPSGVVNDNFPLHKAACALFSG